MITKITTKQSKQINALIKRLCCNCEDGNCLLLDDGDEHSCVQLISKSGIFCNYFKKGVLPADNQLYTEIMSKEKGKKYILCNSYFKPKAKNQRYCQNCAKKQARLKAAERQRRKRALQSRF